MKALVLRRLSCAVVICAAASAAEAGRSCEQQPPTEQSVASAMLLAEHAARALDASGAQVAVIARIGQNLQAYGLRYSHLGFVYRIAPPDADGTPGVWRIVHKLNECGTAHAAVFRQGLGEFFLDDMVEYETAFVIPSADIQANLAPALRDDAQMARLNTPAYSVVAYPWATTYQQSNQWAIETLAMAMDRAATTRPRAQAWLQLHDYQPTTLHIDALTRLGARITKANVAFDDHPNAKRYTDRIETVTVDSVFAWLQREGMGGAPIVIR